MTDLIENIMTMKIKDSTVKNTATVFVAVYSFYFMGWWNIPIIVIWAVFTVNWSTK